MRWVLAIVVALLLAVVAVSWASGDSSGGDDLAAARYLNPHAQLVAAIDLDYEGGQWQQLKRLYARAVGTGVARELFDGPAPATLDGALEKVGGFAGLSFGRDIRPLLHGKLLAAVHVTPASPLSAATRDLLERVDGDKTRFDRRGRPVYVDRRGRRLDRRRVLAAIRERGKRQPRTEVDVAYHIQDKNALDRLLVRLKRTGLKRRALRGVNNAELLGDGVALVGGDTLVAVSGDNLGEKRTNSLLRQRARGQASPNLRLPTPGEALVRLRATAGVLALLLDRDELRRLRHTPPGRALHAAELSLVLSDDAAHLDGRVDFTGLADNQLPLPPATPIELPRDAGIASASADQSRTTVFLARLVRQLYPRSRFIRRVKALERRERLRFEDAVLRQFTGPSQSVLRPTPSGETRFAARSSLRDPAEMRRLLPRIAPRLPGILEGLQGLGQTGLSSLLLVAPDAPLTPNAFGLLASVHVRPLPDRRPSTPGDPGELLYEITGLEQARGVPGLDRVVYGVIGDKFVVASDRTFARRVATMTTFQAEPAGTRLRIDLPRLLREAGGTNAEAHLLESFVAGAEVSASAENGDIVAHGTVRWTPH
ncbi:MAG: hypothetical protein M3Z33_05135 [Actinomycetota bacterium]|nr:hypothetical protein [Actinomycetota bacterium]